MEECNRKLVSAKSPRGDFKKGLVPQGPKLKPTYQPKRRFQSTGNRGKLPQKPFVRQACPQCRKNHGERSCLVGQDAYFGCGKPGHKLYGRPTKNQ